MLRILGVVYLFSLANGLALVALERLWPSAAPSPGSPAEAPYLEVDLDPGILARFSWLWVAAAVAIADIAQRWRGMP